MKITNIKIKAVLLHSIVILCICGMFSCGKKGLPVYPGGGMPEAVDDLRSEINGNMLTLTWTSPEKDIESFIIYQSKTDLSDCRRCPFLFQYLTEIRVESTSFIRSRTFTYNIKLEQGFRYAYKVAAIKNSNIRSPDSNYVEFIY